MHLFVFSTSARLAAAIANCELRTSVQACWWQAISAIDSFRPSILTLEIDSGESAIGDFGQSPGCLFPRLSVLPRRISTLKIGVSAVSR